MRLFDCLSKCWTPKIAHATAVLSLRHVNMCKHSQCLDNLKIKSSDWLPSALWIENREWNVPQCIIHWLLFQKMSQNITCSRCTPLSSRYMAYQSSRIQATGLTRQVYINSPKLIQYITRNGYTYLPTFFTAVGQHWIIWLQSARYKTNTWYVFYGVIPRYFFPSTHRR